MIDLDYDELNTAAVHLLGKVVECVPHRFSAEERIEFRTLVFDKLIRFVRADVPCDVKTSVQLFEQCLKTSELANFPSAAQFNSIETDVTMLFKKMDFTLFASYHGASVSKKQAFTWVQKEVLRGRQALSDNQSYVHTKYRDAILSIEADKHNKRTFKQYFEDAKKTNALYMANPSQLAKYVDPVIEQTQALQMQLASNWDLSTAIHKRRNSQTDDGIYIPGYFFN